MSKPSKIFKSSKLSKSKIKTPRTPEPLSPTSSDSDIPCGQPSPIELAESLVTSLDLRDQPLSLPDSPRRLSREHFRLVRSLSSNTKNLVEIKDHITKQVKFLNRAIQQQNPPPYLRSTARPPHLHRGLQFRKSFSDSWNSATNRVTILLTRLVLDEYTFQLQNIEARLVTTKEAALAKLRETLGGEDYNLAIALFEAFTQPSLKKGQKRKRD